MSRLSDKDAELSSWIREHTSDASTVVELGAGFGVRLLQANTDARRVGIEIFPAYANRFPRQMKCIYGDMREWSSLLNGTDTDTAMLIDSLEHIGKDDGRALVESLKSRFRKILVFTPDGYTEQDSDATGFGNEFQLHECGWSASELESLGFRGASDPEFHENAGALFAVWNCE